MMDGLYLVAAARVKEPKCQDYEGREYSDYLVERVTRGTVSEKNNNKLKLLSENTEYQNVQRYQSVIMDSFKLYPSVPSKESDTRESSIRETGKAGGNIQYKELDARKQRLPQV